MGERQFPFPVRGGLVEEVAAKHFARFGEWPVSFLQSIGRHCGGRVPENIKRMADQLRRARFWEVRDDGPPPGWTRIHRGRLSFLVPTATLTEGKEYDSDAPTP